MGEPLATVKFRSALQTLKILAGRQEFNYIVEVAIGMSRW